MVGLRWKQAFRIYRYEEVQRLWSQVEKYKLQLVLIMTFRYTNSSLFLTGWIGEETGEKTPHSQHTKQIMWKQISEPKFNSLLHSFNVSALCGYLDLAIIGEVSQGRHDLGHCCSQGLLHCLLLPLGDSGEAWQQVDQVGSGPQAMEEGIRMQTEQTCKKHLKLSQTVMLLPVTIADCEACNV